MSTQTAIEAPTTRSSVQPTISRNVKVLLVPAEWDQEDLAEATGLSVTQVSRKMTGRKSSWTPDDLIQLAQAFSQRLGFTVEPGSFLREVRETFGQNWKMMNAADLEVLPGGDEGGQGRFGHLHLVT